MNATAVARPAADEHSPYYTRYIQLVEGDDVLPRLVSQIEDTSRLLSGLDEARASHRYAPEKWSVKQVVGHLSDAERVFSYRAMRMARADATPLPGFDEQEFVRHADFDSRPLEDLLLELRAVRSGSIALFAGLSDEALRRRGVANDQPFSVRAIAWSIAGHELHHRRILNERYGLSNTA